MRLIWATRGHDWGFRFLRNDSGGDPLPVYDAAFTGAGEAPEVWRLSGGTTALRFPDPLGRKDFAGRVIPHEFVLLEGPAAEISSVQQGIERVWPLVADEYAEIWDATPPNS